jgi:hypothetical protein
MLCLLLVHSFQTRPLKFLYKLLSLQFPFNLPFHHNLFHHFNLPLVQPTVSGQVSRKFFYPSIKWTECATTWGGGIQIPLVSGETNVSGLQTHMVGVNQPYYGGIPNPVGPSGSGNIQYQQPYMAQIPLQQAYVPYGSQALVNPPYIPQAGAYVSLVNPLFLVDMVRFNSGTYQYPQGISQGTVQQPLQQQGKPLQQQGKPLQQQGKPCSKGNIAAARETLQQQGKPLQQSQQPLQQQTQFVQQSSQPLYLARPTFAAARSTFTAAKSTFAANKVNLGSNKQAYMHINKVSLCKVKVNPAAAGSISYVQGQQVQQPYNPYAIQCLSTAYGRSISNLPWTKSTLWSR